VNAVFLDTIGLLALWDRGDQWHAAAEAAYARIIAERLPFLTTTFVLLECGNVASRRSYRPKVAKLRRTLTTGTFRVRDSAYFFDTQPLATLAVVAILWFSLLLFPAVGRK
jgi:predicted nucleic acid-binding protein